MEIGDWLLLGLFVFTALFIIKIRMLPEDYFDEKNVEIDSPPNPYEQIKPEFPEEWGVLENEIIEILIIFIPNGVKIYKEWRDNVLNHYPDLDEPDRLKTFLEELAKGFNESLKTAKKDKIDEIQYIFNETLSLLAFFIKKQNIENGKNYKLIEFEKKRSRRITQAVMDKVWNRDGGKCVECGSNEKLEFDHIIPFSKGGANTYRNIQLLCEKCNRSKSDKIG